MRVIYLMLGFIFLLSGGCSAEGSATFGEYEGDEPEECVDGADNDQDGLFDCADEGCAGFPDCVGQNSSDDSDETVDSESARTTDSADSGGDTTTVVDSGADTVTTTDTVTNSDTGTVADTGTPVDTGTGTVDDVDTGSADSSSEVDSGSDSHTVKITPFVPPLTPPAGAPAPMPLISRGLPVDGSQGDFLNYANDDDGATDATLHFSGGVESPNWIAYDLSGVSREDYSMTRLLVNWYWDNPQFGDSPGWIAGDYTIDVHNGSGGGSAPALNDNGWETFVTVTGNVWPARMHVLDFTGRQIPNWIRIKVIASADGQRDYTKIQMDIHDASNGVEDAWFFIGDSITFGSMQHAVGGDVDPRSNFSELVYSQTGSYPAYIRGGYCGKRIDWAREYIDEWMQIFPGPYVTVNLGTNDLNPTSPEDFYNDFKYVVDAIIAAGKIPIIPRIPFHFDDCGTIQGITDKIMGLENEIAEIKQAYVDNDISVLDGPDFFTFFLENPEHMMGLERQKNIIGDPNYPTAFWANCEIAIQDLESYYGSWIHDDPGVNDGDNLHPDPGDGQREYSRLWAEKMLQEVYGYTEE